MRLKPRPVPAALLGVLLAALLAAGLAAGLALRPAPRLVGAEVGFAWPEFRATRTIGDRERLRALDRAVAAATRIPGPLPAHFPYWRLRLDFSDGRRVDLLASRRLAVYLPAAESYLAGEGLQDVLAAETGALAATFFGEPLPWSEVDRLWPRDTKVAVRDLETGARFEVDRYGGYNHADAQPATPRDTRALKAVFGGGWSWRRRAAVVEVAGRRVAASMNGMPHGSGTLPDNDFPGHFCIHFAGSITHGSRRPDLAHRMMILKAAGRLADALDAAPPEEVAAMALTAVFQKDTAALRYAVDGLAEPPAAALLADLLDRVDYVEIHDARPAAPDEVEVRVTVYARPDLERGIARTLRLGLSRSGPAAAWKVRFNDLGELLAPPPASPGGGPDAPAGPAAFARPVAGC